MPSTLAVDFGSRNIGVALVEHPSKTSNRVLYAATVVVDPKWLTETTAPRAQTRRIRRTRKTHRRRLRRLSQALHGIEGSDQILRFCRRRGFSHDSDEDAASETTALHASREVFFDSLRDEVSRVIAPTDRDRVLRVCSRHLNQARVREAELRPARFENRGPTKCQWEGCTQNVPRGKNAIQERLQQALYVWLKPVFDEAAAPTPLRKSVDHWIAELDALGRQYQEADPDDPAVKEVTRRLDRRKNRVFKNLRNRVEREASEAVAESFAANWRSTYSRNLTEIVKGKQGGRLRYCREHSRKFVDCFLAGKVPPNRTNVGEKDLVSRKQQIIFGKLWRLIEARILPLAGGRIDRVVVERVAFDILGGKLKARQDLPESIAAEMYWHGPQRGFPSHLAMFKEEFGERCAYCGCKGEVQEVEHLLPRGQFPFDSYLNTLPSCRDCNRKKGNRSAAEAGLKVHAEAYEAYSQYVGRLRVPHLFHTIKKGFLNLMSRDGVGRDAEKMLGMLADNLVSISNTQRGPRLLARYLARKIQETTSRRCEPAYTAGRHTALYRSIILPDYDKEVEKESANLANHGVDAVMLGCRLPSAAAMENPRWNARCRDLFAWREDVRAAGPDLEDGLPRVDPVAPLEYFETDLGGRYFLIDLSAFNWNRTRRATNKLDPVGKTRNGQPTKREPASAVLANLKDRQERADQIDRIMHQGLRRHLEADPEHAPERLVRWLQATTRAGLSRNNMSSHPSDVARRRLLEEFVNCPAVQGMSRKGGKPRWTWLIGDASRRSPYAWSSNWLAPTRFKTALAARSPDLERAKPSRSNGP